MTDGAAPTQDAHDREALPVFRIGLVMAGAVSAGAYTAGVVDFLLEALDAIEDVRAGRDRGDLGGDEDGHLPVVAPPYRVEISAMSGTSAGGMISAILATMLNARVPPIHGPTEPGENTGNPLYDCWVERVHIDKLLTNTDIVGDKPLMSLLNSEPLRAIAKETLAGSKNAEFPRRFVADALPLHLCVSNMRGVVYSLDLDGGIESSAGHQMSLHADHVSFQLQKEDCAPSHRDVRELCPGKTEKNWELLADVALATAAFPFGLAPQIVTRPFDDYIVRTWPIPSASGTQTTSMCTIPPLRTADAYPNDYATACVDGGVFNNEPLELCRRSLAEACEAAKEHTGTKGRNPREPELAYAAVVMIDPFPDVHSSEALYEADRENHFLAIVKRFIGVQIAQARFKPSELALAKNPNVASRYAILPSRRSLVTDTRVEPAIASGAVGGFGGFLSREFRHHDFMLGRRNCQQFLKTRFVLPIDSASGKVNSIVAGWRDDPVHEKFAAKTNLVVEGKRLEALPIIPLLGRLADPAYTAMPHWPDKPADLNMAKLNEAMNLRANAVMGKLLSQVQLKSSLRAVLQVAWWWCRESLITDRLMGPIHSELKANGIHPD